MTMHRDHIGGKYSFTDSNCHSLTQDPSEAAALTAAQMAMAAAIEAAAAPPWFFSTDAVCEGFGATHSATQLGYETLGNGTGYWRAISKLSDTCSRHGGAVTDMTHGGDG